MRAPWWQPLAPLLTTLLFGGALVLCAGASSPTPTVARMLAEQQQALDAPGSLETATYQLPSHWQWPSLSGDAPSEDIWEVVAEPIEPAPDDRVACDWGVPGSTC